MCKRWFQRDRKERWLWIAMAFVLVGCGGNSVEPDGGEDAPVEDVLDTQQDTVEVEGDAQQKDADGVSTSDGASSEDGVSPDGGGTAPCEEKPVASVSQAFFVDISEASGIRVDNYELHPTQPIPINDHSRITLADINGDGFDDLFGHSLYPNVLQGVPFEHLVFLAQGDGTFVDFSDASGLRDVQAGFFAFGDVDNDGDQDVFAGLDITIAGEQHGIYLNDGEGHFTELENAGLESIWNTVAGTALFADFNGDAELDLFIGNGGTAFAAPDVLLWGQGDGTFVKDSDALDGLYVQMSNGSVACDWDNDGDQDIFVSTYGVSTALGANQLWENQGGVFVNRAIEMGFASLPTGNYYLETTGNGTLPEPGKGPGEYMGSNGFGIDCSDVNNDGYLDIYLATISHPVDSDYNRKWSDPSQLLINGGPENDYALTNEFLERGLSFNEGDIDNALVDFDNDGWLDVSVTRDKKYEKSYPSEFQKGWFGLMRQLPSGSFQDMTIVAGINAMTAAHSASLTECVGDEQCPLPGEACLKDKCRIVCENSSDCPTDQEICHSDGFCKLLLTAKNGQNLGWTDLDHDGDLDLFVGGRDTGGGRPNFLFRNDVGSENRWMALRLVGDGEAINRDAIGARVTVHAGDVVLTREVHSSRGTYTAADTRVVHLGLGSLGCDYTVEIRWPDGTVVSWPSGGLPEDAYTTITYPDQVSGTGQ